MAKSTVTSKGQVTIPKEIRVYAMINKGTEVDFRIDSKGRIYILPISRDIQDIKGIAHRKRKRPVSLEEMKKAIEEGATS